MKSLLVDALRQAHNSRQSRSLSDSGSFDTTDAEFETTANDPVALEETALPDETASPEEAASLEELALYETTTDAALNFDAAYDEPLQDADFDEPLQPVRPPQSKRTSDEESSIPDVRPSQPGLPALAKFAPAICVTAALLAATSWALFRSSELGRDGLTMLELQYSESAGEFRNDRPSPTSAAIVRFPFLDSAGPVADPEVPE